MKDDRGRQKEAQRVAMLAHRRKLLLDELEEPIRVALEGADQSVHLITIAVHLEADGGFATASTFTSEDEAMRALAQCVGVYALHNKIPGVTACRSETPSTD